MMDIWTLDNDTYQKCHELDLASTAIVVIDEQNDYALPWYGRSMLVAVLDHDKAIDFQ